MKKALTRFYFRKLKKGQRVRLFYRGSNEGTFTWTHSHVIEDGEPNVGLASGFRVAGQMTYEDKVDNKPLPVDDYLYECIDGDFPKGAICCGSGAMPLFDDETVADKWQAKLVADSEDAMPPEDKEHLDAWEKAFGEAEQKFENVYSDEAATWIGQQMQEQGF
jgi:hypothetical protein